MSAASTKCPIREKASSNTPSEGGAAMTYVSEWDRKATALAKEADENDERAEAESNHALGLNEPPKGPPTVEAERQMKEMEDHSRRREDFIEMMKKQEAKVTHVAQDDPVELQDIDFKGKAIQIIGSERVRYVIPEGTGILKLLIMGCKHVQVHVKGSLSTSTIEIHKCEELDLELVHPLGTLQVDECLSATRIRYEDQEHVGKVYHQNSPGLAIGWGSLSTSSFYAIGEQGAYQMVTKLASSNASKPLVTGVVVRDEHEYPIDLCSGNGRHLSDDIGDRSGNGLTKGQEKTECPIDVFSGRGHRLDDIVGDGTSELAEREKKADKKLVADNKLFRADDFMQATMRCRTSEIAQCKKKAEEMRLAGNEMFRANDFLQATMQYTEALRLDPGMGTVWANRAQCWLKLGEHEKALADATRCTEVEPKNPKGWFRKGISLHAMKRYPDAIPALVEAEALEPNNRQIPEAIKMAQLMARKQAASE